MNLNSSKAIVRSLKQCIFSGEKFSNIHEVPLKGPHFLRNIIPLLEICYLYVVSSTKCRQGCVWIAITKLHIIANSK